MPVNLPRPLPPDLEALTDLVLGRKDPDDQTEPFNMPYLGEVLPDQVSVELYADADATENPLVVSCQLSVVSCQLSVWQKDYRRR